MVAAPPAAVDGLTSKQAGGGRHGAGRMWSLTCRMALGGLKVARNLTSACTRPATRGISSTIRAAGGRVMRGVGRLVAEHRVQRLAGPVA
jgi:hypothetical protein